jgi:hypothetical protein
MENSMFKSLLPALFLALVAGNAFCMTPQQKTGSGIVSIPDEKQENELIQLYNKVVQQQRAAPERGYGARGSNSMYDALKDSLKSAFEEGLDKIYQGMLSTATSAETFEALFSPQNIQMLAYQQNAFGGGLPYTFTGTLGFSNAAQEPSLINYTLANGKQIVLTRYAYFNGMLKNIAKTAFLAARGDRQSDDQVNVKALWKKLTILEKNLLEAAGSTQSLSAKQVGQIAEELTRKGNMQFLKLISTINGVPYEYKP